MEYRFFYLLWSLVYVCLWGFLFIRRKEGRREMLFISTAAGFGGIAMEWIFIRDWWHPLTITGTPVGTEDFLWPFAIGGIASVIYEHVVHGRLKNTKPVTKAALWSLLVLFPTFFIILFFFLHISSFYTTMAVYLFGISLVLFVRRDLVWNSIASSVLMILVALPVYFAMFALFPNVVREFWFLDERWYTVPLFGIPIEEYIWLFLTGAFVGPLYEFLAHKRLAISKYRKA